MDIKPGHERVQCCIVGAGPAGLVLGLLLARQGVSVKVLELHPDLARDFRGDTVHASTLEMLDQIGLAEGALELPHSKIQQMSINTPDKVINLVNFKRLKTKYPYITMMPQEHFLNYLLECAQGFDCFEILFSTAVTSLLRDEQNRIVGVEGKQDGNPMRIESDLVVACDGRFSTLRRLTGFKAESQSQPIDIAWLRFPRLATEEDDQAGFYVADGNLCIVLNRIDVWQVAFVHAKGDFKQLREKGIEHFRQGLRQTIPWLQDRVDTITDFSDLHILNVRADMLDTWYLNGLLLIGDSAHAMSPVGGIGINFAIADAIETANILSEPLLAGACTSMHLAEVQNRRFKATKTVQGIQTRILNQITSRAFGNKEFDLPWLVRVLLKTPFLRDIPARLMAFGPYQAKIHKP